MSFENVANLLILNKEPFPTRKLTPLTAIKSNTTQDTKQASKLLLKSALQRANIAVQCDSANDVLGAMNAYKEAISLLDKVLSTVEKENDKQRLQSIHDSYSERIRLLSNITSKLDTDKNACDTDHTPNQYTMMRRITSKSSIRTNLRSPICLNYWQDNNSSPVSQKEPQLPKHPSISPPTFHLKVSKSTPTHSIKPTNLKSHRNSDEIVLRPHKYILQKKNASSNRSSVSSMNSIDLMVEQPGMALPSLKSEESSALKIKTAFRLSSSSLSTMHRSSSMSNVDTMIYQEDLQQQDSEQPSSQIYPPQMIINRPGSKATGLGSMRRKAVHRLSMDSFTLGRNKDKLTLSPSVGDYDFFQNDEQQDEPPELDSQNDSSSVKHAHLKLVFALEKSILEGAHITPKLYIPRNLWQQPNIRLSSMDIKMTACETLIREMNKLENWYLDDLKSTLKILNHFESIVKYIQTSLSKKLKNSNNGNLQNSGSNKGGSFSPVDSKKSSSFISLGAKLTKFSLKTEDQYKNYIETLQRFFSRVHILEQWLDYYQSTNHASKYQGLLIAKLVKICTVINDVIGGFIVRDVAVLLTKWLKRGGSWVYE